MNIKASLPLLAATAALFGLSGCLSSRSASDYDPVARFPSQTSYAFMQRGRGTGQDQLELRQIEQVIEARLAYKGFKLVSDPERVAMVVDFTVGTEGRVDIQSYPAAYAGSWFWDAPLRTGPYWGRDIDSRVYREGILSIDIFDQRTRRPIWHGWSRIPISPAQGDGSKGSIEQVVHDVLSEYPPGHLQ
jgi:Domain of unknown function (DUF4136)